jgi:hypothetical protein
VKENGILFSAPMVHALLLGIKTQTRRALRPQPPDEPPAGLRCRLGAPGDRLWVRETFVAYGRWETRYNQKKQRSEWYFIDMTLETGQAYRFDRADPAAARRAGATPTWHKRPALFMPRVASRILLEIASVRTERLLDISDQDVISEGCPDGVTDARAWYRQLWETLNGPGSWDANPWVWVVDFRRVMP